VDPLVLDLGGDGPNLTGVSVAAPTFDVNHTGFAIHTGWVQPTDGMLALDRNGNGVIDNGTELFGGLGVDGFDALRAYDSNSDGIIDASDPVFAQLRVWQDLNQDAVSDPAGR
jgi:hypothetical protein